MTTETNIQLKEEAKHEIVYEAGGQTIKLNPSIVAQFITKGNAKISMQEAVNFMQLCKYSELNPFLNEAYLIKFSNDKPADMVVSKEAFMKRAERQSSYKGNKAGVVVLDKDGELVEREGTIYSKNEELLGGWAKVFRSDREEPTYISINFQEFAKYKFNGDLQATWSQMPANMIRKSALVNALREAYPDQLGAMYTEDEPNPTEIKQVAETPQKDAVTEELLQDFKVDNKEKQETEEVESYVEISVGEFEEVEDEPEEKHDPRDGDQQEQLLF